MPEILPDLSDESRCISVHWTLPVQCILPRSHRENWHEAWHPQTGNRLRYQRSMGSYTTEDLHHGEWHDLEIPPPGGFCDDQYISAFGDSKKVRCTEQYGHGWNHRAIVDGCTYSWNTAIPKGLNVDQLTHDVKQLRGMTVDAHARIAELETELADLSARARRVAVSHEHFIYDHSDPGTEALGSQYELVNYLSAMPGEAELPVNPAENALRVVLALLDEYDENVTPSEIRKALAEFLPRDDASDNRRRLYIDGKGNGWISVCHDEGAEWVVPVQPEAAVEQDVRDVADETGSLREIGRCW